jgi:hypothetical protein
MVDYKELLAMLLSTPKGQIFQNDPRFKVQGNEPEEEVKNKYLMLQNVIRMGKNPISITPSLTEMLEELVNQTLEEKLCPAGKAYIKKRKAAGEKSSAYLSGRAVKVCKGQMKG